MKVTNELDQIVGYFYQIKELKRQEKVSYLFQINMELKWWYYLREPNYFDKRISLV